VLTWSSLYRYLNRHAISRLPEIAGDKAAKKPFKRYRIGHFHLDIAEVRTEERLKLATVNAVAEIRRSLRMETSSGGPAGCRRAGSCIAAEGPTGLTRGCG
jgi:hypothetical protein